MFNQTGVVEMVGMQSFDVVIRPTYLAALLHQKDAIRALAVQLVAGQVEGHLDMINDAGPKEYSSFQEVDACILGAKESVNDYVEDLLTDFRDTLYNELAKVKIETKAVILKPSTRDGISIDADVDVTIE
jgi:hypothetical protein